MMLRVGTIIILVFLSFSAYGASQKRGAKSVYDSIELDSQFSFNRGAWYRAYKMQVYLKEKAPRYFRKSENYSVYLDTMVLLSSKESFFKECQKKKISDSEKYVCAKKAYEHGWHQFSNQLLNTFKVKDKSKALKLSIMRASNYLALNNAEACLDELKGTSTEMKDVVSLTLARCNMLSRRYSKAIYLYKKVESSSQHYMDSLYELAWAQFKSRDIADAKGTINVLINSYADFEEDRASISQREYFDLRYLMAYLGLIQVGASDVSKEMDLALADLNKIKKQTRFEKMSLGRLVDTIGSGKQSWDQLIKENKDFAALIDFYHDWGSRYLNDKLVKDLRYYLALSLELADKTTRSNPGYRRDLERIHNRLGASLKKGLWNRYQDTKSSLQGFELRAQLAKRKSSVLQATKGIRSLEQAKEIYRGKENYLNSLIGELE